MAYWVMVEYATVPKIPFRISVSHRDGKQFQFRVYHQIAEHDFEPVLLQLIQQ